MPVVMPDGTVCPDDLLVEWACAGVGAEPDGGMPQSLSAVAV